VGVFGLRTIPVWLRELREEAQSVESEIASGSEEEISYSESLDTALEQIGKAWESSITSEIAEVVFEIHSEESIKPTHTTRFLYSALMGCDSRLGEMSESAPFHVLIAQRVSELGLTISDIAERSGIKARPASFDSSAFIPWRLAVEQIRKISELLDVSISLLRRSIASTRIVPDVSAALTRSSSSIRDDTDDARLVSERYVSLKRQLKAKTRLLRALDLLD